MFRGPATAHPLAAIDANECLLPSHAESLLGCSQETVLWPSHIELLALVGGELLELTATAVTHDSAQIVALRNTQATWPGFNHEGSFQATSSLGPYEFIQ